MFELLLVITIIWLSAAYTLAKNKLQLVFAQ